jgi:NAD+ diphosphatase
VDHLRRSSLNYFAAHRLDRAAARRADRTWILERLADPRTGVVPVWRARNLVGGGYLPRPVMLSPPALGAPEALVEHAVLLGEIDGRALFAVELVVEERELEAHLPPESTFHELRDLGALLEREDAALLAYARALVHWHRRHRHCGDCGAPSAVVDGGHQRVCTAAGCGARHFPRTDPAVIVLVVADRGEPATERCLLGRQSIWPQRMYSTIAGFVEPGESLEDAVVREVAEETGVMVADVHYHSSQPWPFPSSLMLGFTATALGDRIVRHDDELSRFASSRTGSTPAMSGPWNATCERR